MTIENIFSTTAIYIESISNSVSNVIENIPGTQVHIDYLVNTQRITVSETPPPNPSINDLWINITGELVTGSGGFISQKITDTLTGDDTVIIPANSILVRIVVNPASDLTAFKIGTTLAGDELISEQPVVAGFNVFNIDAYYDTNTTLYFSGITSSTQIIVYYA